MDTLAPSFTPKKSLSAPATILLAGCIAGCLDLTYAFVSHGLRGNSPGRVLRGVASALLGRAAFPGGAQVVVLGLALHVTVALSAAAVYYALSRKFPSLTARPVLGGLLYGFAVYLFMYGVVMPLSAMPKFRNPPAVIVADILAHLFLIGLPIALAVRWAGARGDAGVR